MGNSGLHMSKFIRSVLTVTLLLSMLVTPSFGGETSWEVLIAKLNTKFLDDPRTTIGQRMSAAVPIAQEALENAMRTYGKNSPEVGRTLCTFGKIYFVLGDSKSSLRYYEPAYVTLGKIELKDEVMDWAPDCYYEYLSTKLDLGDVQYVINWYKHYPLPPSESAPDQITKFDLESMGLLARAYSLKGQHKTSLKMQKNAYELHKKMGSADSFEALGLIEGMSWNYRYLNRVTESLEVLSAKLDELEAKSQKASYKIALIACPLASAQNSVGYTNEARSNNQKCLSFFENQAKSSAGYYDALYTAGLINFSDQKFQDAYSDFSRSEIGLTPLVGERSERLASILRAKGMALFALKRYDQSIDELEKSIAIERSLGIPVNSASYGTLSSNYQVKRNYIKSTELATIAYAESRLLYGDNNIRTAYSMTVLGYALIANGNRDIGIAYLKSAINLIQMNRAEVRAGGLIDVNTYTQAYAGLYGILADELFEAGRFNEGQLVLDMLKQDEFFEYIRRDKDRDPRSTRVPLSKAESAEVNRYNQLLAKVTQLELERSAITRKSLGTSRNIENESELIRIDHKIKAANNAVSEYLRQNIKTSTQGHALTKKAAISELSDAALTNKINLLKKLGPDTALVQYFLTSDKLGMVVTTAEGTTFKVQRVTPDELNSMVFKFYAELRNPKADSKKAGKALYDLLIEPIALDLNKRGVKTIMLSLDGTLRYIPFAALYDGKQFLVEKYNLPVYTSVASKKIVDVSKTKWRVAALGVSKELGGHKALPSVKIELAGIVQEAGGVLPGKIFLDDKFTAQSLKGASSSDFSVLHIASHFAFSPGTEANSYLLLGDGAKLTLGDIRKEQFRFDGTELLTLSACETGLGGGYAPDGKEIEGFAVVAQHQGAKSVLATLWKVEDKSTSLLMADMYAQKLKGKTKIEALHQAQLDLKQRPEYSHPYYWAPFILMGNWQ